MTVFDVLLPMMRGALRSHIKRARRRAKSLEACLSRENGGCHFDGGASA